MRMADQENLGACIPWVTCLGCGKSFAVDPQTHEIQFKLGFDPTTRTREDGGYFITRWKNPADCFAACCRRRAPSIPPTANA